MWKRAIQNLAALAAAVPFALAVPAPALASDSRPPTRRKPELMSLLVTKTNQHGTRPAAGSSTSTGS